MGDGHRSRMKCKGFELIDLLGSITQLAVHVVPHHCRQRIWKEYFEDLYNIDTQEQVEVHMCSFDGIQRGNFGGELTERAEVEVKVEKL